MAKVNVLVLTGYGTNSHAESAHAALLAGADRADIVHFSDIVEGEARLEDYHMLVFPGGFLDGDDLGAAQAAGAALAASCGQGRRAPAGSSEPVS